VRPAPWIGVDRLHCPRIRSLDVTENVLLEAASLYKRSGGLQARSRADLFIRAGEVHALAVIPEER